MTPDVDPVLEALENPVDAPFFAEAGDPGPMIDDGGGGSRFERPPFPMGGPVRCLGINSDMSGSIRCYYLDSIGQIVGLDANNRHGKNALIALYGPTSDWLEAEWPQWSKPVREYDKSEKKWIEIEPSKIVGFDQAEASRAHIEECVRQGIFDPTGKLRGRGAHRTEAGNLILHLGDVLMMPVEDSEGNFERYLYQDPGVYYGQVYPAAAKSTRPSRTKTGPEAGQAVLAQLQTWCYRRQLLDPMLLLGGIAASMLGGFLAWRPTMWIIGPRGSGKSTLDGEPSATEGFIGHLLGSARMNSSGVTEAAIRRQLANSTVPVFIDELEPTASQEKIEATVALARVSSGGSKQHRVGVDMTVQEFTLRSCFWFSSILQAPLQSADYSRIVTIELRPIGHSSVKPDFFKDKTADLGARLLRRMVDRAVELDRVIAIYAAALSQRGLDSRGQSVYGTLLGCAHVALYDEMPDDELVTEWAVRLDPRQLVEAAAATSDEQACLDQLLTSQVQSRGGDERVSLGSWIADAIADVQNGNDAGTAGRKLQQIGLKLVSAKLLDLSPGPDGVKVPRFGAQAYVPGEPGWLAVAWKHRGLDPLFNDTKWRGGVWRQQLGRVTVPYGAREAKGAAPTHDAGELGAIDNVKVKFDRISANAVLVPLSAFLEDVDLPVQSEAGTARAWIDKVVADAAAAAIGAGAKGKSK